MAEQEQHDGSHRFHHEGGGIVFEKPKSQEEIARETRDREQHEFARDQVKTNRRLAWFTGLLVLGTFIGTGIGIWQASISQTAANAAREAAKSAQGALKEQRLAREQASIDAQHARDANSAENKAADQRNMIALTASATQSRESLDASITAYRNDLRAWLTTSDIHLAKEPAIGEDLVVAFDVVNSGRTPAINVSMRYHSPINFTEPPATYDWTSIVPRPTSMIFPGGSLRDERLVIEGAKMTQTVVDTYRAGRTSIFVQIRLEYDDVFSCRHWSQTCDAHAFGDAQFSQCKTDGGIGIDTGPCQKAK